MVTSGPNIRLWIIAVVALALVGSAAGVCRADDAADVKHTVKDFTSAASKGDAAAAKAFLTSAAADGQFGQFVDAVVAACAAHNQFEEVAVAKFDKEGPGDDEEAPTAHLSRRVERITFNVQGDDAVDTGGGLFKLTKIGGAWKIVQIGEPREWKVEVGIFRAWAQAARQTAQEIKDGKYTSRAQAWTAFASKRSDLDSAQSKQEPATLPSR